jgi:hypothetical protein
VRSVWGFASWPDLLTCGHAYVQTLEPELQRLGIQLLCASDGFLTPLLPRIFGDA